MKLFHDIFSYDEKIFDLASRLKAMEENVSMANTTKSVINASDLVTNYKSGTEISDIVKVTHCDHIGLDINQMITITSEFLL